MARFLLDHNVARQVTTILRNWNHQASTAMEAGLARSDDAEIMLVAARTQSILLTHNGSGFRLLHSAWRRWSESWETTQVHAGVIVCPQMWTAPEIARQLDILPQGYYYLENQLHFWQVNGGWTELHLSGSDST